MPACVRATSRATSPSRAARRSGRRRIPRRHPRSTRRRRKRRRAGSRTSSASCSSGSPSTPQAATLPCPGPHASVTRTGPQQLAEVIPMLRSLFICVVVLSAVIGPVRARAADIGVITGSDKGTYYQFGLNLQALGKPNGVTVTVHNSKGSVENIYAVYQRPGVQVGIVQSDVLAFVAKVQSDPTLQRIAKKIKMVFPLYNEEIHLLGRGGIASFDDLANKRVAIGREGSGTYLTTRLLFKVSEVAPREMVPIDTDEALAELKAGRIDAMFFVAGLPVKLLAEGVTAADELVLVPITNKDIAEFYPRVTIPGGTYAWQPQAVESVTVKAV